MSRVVVFVLTLMVVAVPQLVAAQISICSERNSCGSCQETNSQVSLNFGLAAAPYLVITNIVALAFDIVLFKFYLHFSLPVIIFLTVIIIILISACAISTTIHLCLCHVHFTV